MRQHHCARLPVAILMLVLLAACGRVQGPEVELELQLACPSPTGRLTAADTEAFDDFGRFVAVSANTLFVGAPSHDTSGSVYVFACRKQGLGWSWVQEAKLKAADATAAFGYSLAIRDNTLVVGAPHDSEGGPFAGAAYVFTRKGSSWIQQAKLTAADAVTGNAFGASVAISANTIVIGAPGDYGIDPDDLSVFPGSGSAYVFVRQGTSWVEQAKLAASDSLQQDSPQLVNRFGEKVAISGNTITVGAPGDGYGVGSVYIFVRRGTNWVEQVKLAGGSAGLHFGWSVAIDGNTAVVGQLLRDGDLAAMSWGAAYVFVRKGGSWTLQAELSPSDAEPYDYFGWSVAIRAKTVVVGNPYKGGVPTSGAAYAFVRQGTTWSEELKLNAPDDAGSGWFGISVALDQKTVAVGSLGPLGAGLGAVYLYPSP